MVVLMGSAVECTSFAPQTPPIIVIIVIDAKRRGKRNQMVAHECVCVCVKRIIIVLRISILVIQRVYRDDGTFRWQILTQDVQPTAKGLEQMRLATMKTIIIKKKKKRPTLLLLWDPFLCLFCFLLIKTVGAARC
jgi:hypothetical protein